MSRENYVELNEKHLTFYKNLKKDQLGEIHPNKINEIIKFATFFSAGKPRDLKYRFISAIEKAYICYTAKKLTHGSNEAGNNISVLSIENDAEVLLFIMFVTDPEHMLLNTASNKKTIEEMKMVCNKYLYFWDRNLLLFELKYSKLLIERQSGLLNNEERDNLNPSITHNNKKF